MKIKVNKHSNKFCWFTMDFIHPYDHTRVVTFFDERFPNIEIDSGKYVEYFDGCQMLITCLTGETSKDFECLWLLGDRYIYVD